VWCGTRANLGIRFAFVHRGAWKSRPTHPFAVVAAEILKANVSGQQGD
jgi:hypothetical protein